MLVPKDVCKVMQADYHQRIREKWGESMFQHIYKISDLTSTYETKVGESHKLIANSRRKNLYHPDLKLNITDNVPFPAR